ncbi:MAG: hypothetical protein ACLS29_05510 [Prevotellamassilia sp.]
MYFQLTSQSTRQPATAHGVTDVVVCPGSRNATIVHDFTRLPDAFVCTP